MLSMNAATNCKRCKRIILNEEHRLSHECSPKIAEFTGTLEERKEKLYQYYNNAFIENRKDIFERAFSAFTYEAMNELGKSVVDLPHKSRSIHANVKQTKEAADLEFGRKYHTLTDENERKILEISESIRCQSCVELAKFYCCKDGCYCSETCQMNNLHFSDCKKALKDPNKDAAVPMIKRIPQLQF